MKAILDWFIALPLDVHLLMALSLVMIIVFLVRWPKRMKPVKVQSPDVLPTEEPVIKPMINVKVEDDGYSKALIDESKAMAEFGNSFENQKPEATYAQAADAPDGEPDVITIQQTIEDGLLNDSFSPTDACQPLDQPDILEDRLQQEASSHLGFDAHRMEVLEAAGNWKHPDDALVHHITTDGIVPMATPKLTREKALRAANKNREAVGKARVDYALSELRANLPFELVAEKCKVKPESLRKLLNKHGYRMNGQPKRVA